jgi:site-specific recombinase XerD
MSTKTPGTNLVRKNYNSISTNYVICVDITSLGRYGSLFLGQDLASRCIVFHCYQNRAHFDFDNRAINLTLSAALRHRSFLPPVRIIHSDRGSEFKNENFASFLAGNGITHSRGSSEGHQNQVIERLNRSIKDIIKTELNSSWRKSDPKIDPLKTLDLSIEKFSALVTKSIEIYNNRPHRMLQHSTPNEMEEALFKAHLNEHPKGIILYNAQSDVYQDYQTKVLTEYQGDWVRFFDEWLKETRENHAEVIMTLKEKAAAATEQYESLYSKYLKIQQDLERVLDESLIAKEARESREARKSAHKNRKKAPVREVITPSDLMLILNSVKGRSLFQKARRRLCLILLYMTGLRVSNLLTLTVSNVSDLFEFGRTKIRLIKDGDSRFNLVVSKKDRRRLVKDFIGDFTVLNRNKNGLCLLITSQDGTRLSREYLDQELNIILKKASIQLEKHLRTHSFRASYVTDYLEIHDLHEVSQLVGHNSISSTNAYNRNLLTTKDKQRLLKDRPAKKKASGDD